MKSSGKKHSNATAIVLETLKETERALSNLRTLIITLMDALAKEADDRADSASIQQQVMATRPGNNFGSARAAEELQREALYSWKEIAPFVGISRETWRRRVAEGKAPQPIYLSSRCTRYRGSDVRNWIESPSAYQAPAGKTATRITTGGKE